MNDRISYFKMKIELIDLIISEFKKKLEIIIKNIGIDYFGIQKELEIKIECLNFLSQNSNWTQSNHWINRLDYFWIKKLEIIIKNIGIDYFWIQKELEIKIEW